MADVPNNASLSHVVNPKRFGEMIPDTTVYYGGKMAVSGVPRLPLKITLCFNRIRKIDFHSSQQYPTYTIFYIHVLILITNISIIRSCFTYSVHPSP